MNRQTFAVVALLVMFGVSAATATPITLSDLNSTATFDFPSGGSGLIDWNVDNVSQLHQQWFWYRIGQTDPELPINTLNLDTVKVSDGNINPGDDRVVAYYSGSGLEVSLDHILSGGSLGTGKSDIAEIIKIKNTRTSTMDFHFFQFVDLNLMNDPYDTLVQIIPSGHAAKQSKGDYAVAEVVDTPPPSLYQADYAVNLQTLLGDGVASNLNNQPSAANGDLAWAFQWNVVLGPGQELLISKDKNLAFIPEPSSIVLLGMGALGLLAFAWQRRRAI